MNDLASRVTSWREETYSGAERGVANGVIAQFFRAILSCLRTVTTTSGTESPEPPYYQSLERSAATLITWGGDHDVSHGGLDNVLQHPGCLRDSVLITLISIGDLLGRTNHPSWSLNKDFRDAWDVSIATISAFTETAEYALEDASDLSVDDAVIEADMKELSRGLSVYVRNLTRLSRSLECTAAYGTVMLNEKKLDDVQTVRDIPVHQYFVALIAARFPTANAELVEVLGLSNWSRYRHVQRQREIAQMQAEAVMGEDAKTQFHDSGFATARSVSQQVQSIHATSLASGSHRRLLLLPKKAHLGESFTCEVCGRVISLRRTRDWKKHIYNDICAYTCIFPSCPNAETLFGEVAMLVNHIEEKHCEVPGLLDIMCPLCSEHLEGPTATACNHLARHMEEIALGVLPTTVEVEEDSETTSNQSGAEQKTPPSPHPFTELQTLAEPRSHGKFVGTIVDELDETGSKPCSSNKGSIKPAAHPKLLKAQASEQKPLDDDGPNLSTRGKTQYYWVCCKCGYDLNSYELNSGCTNKCRHWRDSCCRLYTDTLPEGR